MSGTDRLNTALADRYRIEKQLGQGGMATVYLASDLKHDRKVAVKVLKPELAAVLGAERFVVEIKTTAALQHPHILPLFDSGTADGFLYYVMPYIEGETLRDKLSRETQLGIDEAVRITTQVADALDYAHRHGVIHRDIKPENILLHDGRPMVADFGIALAVSAAAGGRMTETGLSLGTPHYMSPEQATAEKEITGRSDIYSLASVLFEMLAGQPPHMGGSAQQIIMKIITESAAPVTALRKSVPPNIAAALARALEKLPADRFEQARAFADALGNPGFTTAGAAVAASVGPGKGWVASSPLLLGAVGLALLAGAYQLGRVTAPALIDAPVVLSVDLPDSMTAVNRCCGPAQALSPDGRTLVFVGMRGGGGALYRRSLGDLGVERIPGTDGGATPFFSPDGTWLAFDVNGQLKKLATAGGPIVPVAATGPINGAAWLEGDVIVYAANADRELWRVGAAGGRPERLPRPDSTARLRMPAPLPGGTAVLAAQRGPTTPLDQSSIVVVDVASGRMDTLAVGTRAVYGNGFIVIAGSDGTLLAQRFDPKSRRTSGQPTPILTGVSLSGATAHEFSLSANGWLEYSVGTGSGFEALRVAAAGGLRRIALPGPATDNLEDPAVAPDGRRIALTLERGGSGGSTDIWLLEQAGGTLNRLTIGGARTPVWSRDGRQIAYAAAGDGATIAGLYVRLVDRTGSPQLVLAGNVYPSAWMPDGRTILFSAAGQHTGWDVGVITIGDSVPRWILRSEFSERHAQVSPDGRWLSYSSDLTGRLEVYVRPLTGDAAPVQVSVDGGASARWGVDSRTLYFINAGEFVAASLAIGSGVAVTRRATVVRGPLVIDTNAENVNWSLFPDGKQFLFIDQGTQDRQPHLALVQNWMALALTPGANR